MIARQQPTNSCSHRDKPPARELIISQRGKLALIQLLHSYEYGEKLSRSVWDFALEMWVLRKLGLTVHDLCWLMCKGFIAQGHELPPTEQGRVFLRSKKLTFSRRTCFVATEDGIEFIHRALAQTWNPADKAVEPNLVR